MQQLTLALDWTPNINHVGFFVAREKGFYRQQGVAVEIVDPSLDNYALTPAKKVELGDADFALCPSESIISYRTKSRPCPLVAIAVILQEDLSAIAVRQDSGIDRPRDLDGKSYASYRARYEDEMVRCMMRNDGGVGELSIKYPAKLGIWDTVLSGEFDATWIFMNWEAIGLTNEVARLNYFRMEDYGIPYGYSPVIAANEPIMKLKSERYQSFLAATRSGYQFARNHPQQAVDILRPFVPDYDQHIDLLAALEASSASFGNEAQWGRMDQWKVQQFLDWLHDNKLEQAKLTATELFSNSLL